jgi:hypothetical protein
MHVQHESAGYTAIKDKNTHLGGVDSGVWQIYTIPHVCVHEYVQEKPHRMYAEQDYGGIQSLCCTILVCLITLKGMLNVLMGNHQTPTPRATNQMRILQTFLVCKPLGSCTT